MTTSGPRLAARPRGAKGRLHAIVDGQQRREFIRFIHNLQADHEQQQTLIAWTPRSPRYHTEIRLAAQQRTSLGRWT